MLPINVAGLSAYCVGGCKYRLWSRAFLANWNFRDYFAGNVFFEKGIPIGPESNTKTSKGGNWLPPVPTYYTVWRQRQINITSSPMTPLRNDYWQHDKQTPSTSNGVITPPQKSVCITNNNCK